jgi:hypothetical protein
VEGITCREPELSLVPPVRVVSVKFQVYVTEADAKSLRSKGGYQDKLKHGIITDFATKLSISPTKISVDILIDGVKIGRHLLSSTITFDIKITDPTSKEKAFVLALGGDSTLTGPASDMILESLKSSLEKIVTEASVFESEVTVPSDAFKTNPAVDKKFGSVQKNAKDDGFFSESLNVGLVAGGAGFLLLSILSVVGYKYSKRGKLRRESGSDTPYTRGRF